ncbi:helix-turn-helix domain-containing protein [Flavobacterium sp. LHD-80]|uniref:helix-turn-helix domain-containing protein n=1 Tax=Flavobacterium sp. LHD-80 TaxID=3071411 RepID=UPI0027DF477B|nr:helix-turn-helix domain-containing protein [Flavobacterium sp. LHD-80]MDQ6470061.1 helix-turn-helix domain-containing protein [Flavobacterium sp. LHD-80]
MKKIQFIGCNPEQFQKKFNESVKIQLEEFLKHYKPVQPSEYLTRQQVAKMFDVNICTVNNWANAGKIRRLGIGSRVYFLRSDIEASLKPLDV